MRKSIFIGAFLLALATAPHSFAQKQALPTQFASWTCKPSAEDMEFDRIANSADIAKETGLKGGEFYDYVSGAAKIHVDLKKYHDPSSAYEIYTALIRPAMHPSTLDRTSAVDGDRMFVLVGNSILKVRPTPAIPTVDLVALVNSVSAHADQTPLPPIRTYLPKGFTDGTQKYALGPAGFQNALTALKREEFAGLANEAGFTSGAEAILAEYGNSRESAGLLLIEYPTPQLAEQHLRHLEQALSPAAKQAGTTIERNASLLTVVLKPSSKAYGDSLRGAVNYGTQVTWNEPTHTITDPPWLMILSRIFIATGMFMVVAVALGIAFGGVRVFAKIFFPGKIFDRPEQMEVLQLGLSSKRIDPRDFY